MNKIFSLVMFLGITLFLSAQQENKLHHTLNSGDDANVFMESTNRSDAYLDVEVPSVYFIDGAQDSSIQVNNNPQSQEIEENGLSPKRFAFAIHIMGPAALLGVGLEAMLSNRFALDVNVGLLSASLGAKLFITNPEKQRVNFNVAYHYGAIVPIFAVYNFHYPSIGITYFSAKNIHLALNVGAFIIPEDNSTTPYGGLSLGFRF